MATNDEVPDFNLRRPPASIRVTNFANGILTLVFASTPMLWVVAVELVLAIVVTRSIRAGHGFWFQLIAFVVGFAVLELVGGLLRGFVLEAGWFAMIAQGKPRFSPLGGPGTHDIRFVHGCIKSLRFRFDPEAERMWQLLGQKDLLEVESTFRQLYEAKGYAPQSWPVWWERIQQTTEKGVSYRDAVSSGMYSVFMQRAATVARFVLTLVLFYIVGTAWFLSDVATGSDPLRLVQFALTAGFIMALILFINFTVSLRTITVVERPAFEDPSVNLTLLDQGIDVRRIEADIDAAAPGLQSTIASMWGREFYPDITILPGYVEQIRNRFFRAFAWTGVLNVAMLCVILLIQWPLARLLSTWPDDKVDDWTVGMLVGTPLMPVALIVAMALGFMVVSRFRAFLGILATGLLLAAIPPVISYAFGGASDSAVLISSIVVALVGVIPGAIAELVKKRPGSPEPG